MTPILNLYELKSSQDFEKTLNAYHSYLHSIKDRLPPAAFSFAIADWHYNVTDPRCTHDTWLESIVIKEPASGSRHEVRSIEIHARLLGAFHDGYIELEYKQVKAYSLSTPIEFEAPPLGVGHGDWLNDEIRLSDRDHIIHEVKFSRGSRWIIECGDIFYNWKPFTEQYSQ